MTKRILLIFGFLLSLTTQNIASISGPYPMLYSPYHDSPASRLTPQQQTLVQQAFRTLYNAFSYNHKICSTRGDCLRLDQTTLESFINSHPSHPANPMLQNISSLIRNDSQTQTFTTQWAIFQNLSQYRQTEYRQGLRIMPLRSQMVKKPWGTTWVQVPATFHQDDILTTLLDAIQKNHRNCSGYLNCQNSDLQIISRLQNSLSGEDPARLTLGNLFRTIKNQSDKQIFNTHLYLNLYNPLSPNWFDTAKKNQDKRQSQYGYTQWQDVLRSQNSLHWYSARITNGTPIATQNTGSFAPPYQPQKTKDRSLIRELIDFVKEYRKN